MTWQASSHNPATSEPRGEDSNTDIPQPLTGYSDLLSVQDLHELTGLSEQTIRTEINSGNLPGCRIGRRLYVPKKNLLEYIENGGGLR